MTREREETGFCCYYFFLSTNQIPFRFFSHSKSTFKRTRRVSLRRRFLTSVCVFFVVLIVPFVSRVSRICSSKIHIIWACLSSLVAVYRIIVIKCHRRVLGQNLNSSACRSTHRYAQYCYIQVLIL